MRQRHAELLLRRLLAEIQEDGITSRCTRRHARRLHSLGRQRSAGRLQQRRCCDIRPWGRAFNRRVSEAPRRYGMLSWRRSQRSRLVRCAVSPTSAGPPIARDRRRIHEVASSVRENVISQVETMTGRCGPATVTAGHRGECTTGRGADGRQLRTRIDVPIDADLTSVHDLASDVYERVAGLLGEGRFTTPRHPSARSNCTPGPVNVRPASRRCHRRNCWQCATLVPRAGPTVKLESSNV